MYLYHYQIGFPTNMRRWTETLDLIYTEHARRAAHEDRFGRITVLPLMLNTKAAQLIEAEATDEGEMLKGVYRLPYDDRRDLVVVVLANGVVKTVWSNLRNDVHRTLRRDLYAVPAMES